MTLYGVGIIGTGWVAGPYAEAFQQHPQTIVKAICSRAEERGKAFVKKLDLSGCQIYTDYEKMIRDPEVDIVVICTPNALHAEQTIAAAQEKKHIIIEKPIALTWSDMQAMHKAVKEAGVKTIVGFVLRWHPLFVTLKELMTQQALGKLFYAEADYYHEVRPGRPNLSWIQEYGRNGTPLCRLSCSRCRSLFCGGRGHRSVRLCHPQSPIAGVRKYDCHAAQIPARGPGQNRLQPGDAE